MLPRRMSDFLRHDIVETSFGGMAIAIGKCNRAAVITRQ